MLYVAPPKKKTILCVGYRHRFAKCKNNTWPGYICIECGFKTHCREAETVRKTYPSSSVLKETKIDDSLAPKVEEETLTLDLEGLPKTAVGISSHRIYCLETNPDEYARYPCNPGRILAWRWRRDQKRNWELTKVSRSDWLRGEAKNVGFIRSQPLEPPCINHTPQKGVQITMSKQLYTYAIIVNEKRHPVTQDIVQDAEVLVPVTTVMANGKDQVHAIASRAIPATYVEDQDKFGRVVIIIREF